jgi:23S rRNA (adenine2503-C2)-methyltransferase
VDDFYKNEKKVLSGLSCEALGKTLDDLPAFRVRQIFKWLARGVPSFDEMTDLPLSLRETLAKRFSLYSSEVSARFVGADGSVKFCLALADKYHIEAVLLADGAGRRTACLSSQAGCALKCAFCKTGGLGFYRNLSPREIIEQFLHARSMGEIANIVVMGMGEPLLNLAALREALRFLMEESAEKGENETISKRRITVSTAGIADGIVDLADNGPDVRLAVSLTTADAELRERLMPVTASNPLSRLKESLLYYQQKKRKRITLEAALLHHINTRQRDADLLAEFADGLDAVVNLIPWNPVPDLLFDGKELREPSPFETDFFFNALRKKGLNVTKRLKKGRSISASCGQLGGFSQKYDM